MYRNHYRKLHGRQGVVERNWQGATHTKLQGEAVMDKRVTPRAHYVRPTSGGHTLGRSDRPHATASIDPKGYGRMRGTAADHSMHYPWVLLPSGTGDRNAATEPKGARPNGRHGGTRKGRRRRNLPHSQGLIIGHHWPAESETVRQ